MTAVYWQQLTEQGVVLRPRDSYDFYPTDPEFVESGLDLIPLDKPQLVLDPGAGMGVWGKAARYRWSQAWITGVELNPNVPGWRWYDHNIHGDFLTHCWEAYPKFDVVIGNPPYSLAEEFVTQSLCLLRDGGYLVFLLRLAFLESLRRYAFFRHQCPPARVVVCSDRPSFTGNGQTDSSAYAFFIWRKGYVPEGGTRLEWVISRAANEKHRHYQPPLFGSGFWKDTAL